jgi:hypothetical protein
MVFALASQAQATTITLTPTTTDRLVASGPENSQAVIDAILDGLIGHHDFLYKDNEGGVEEGSFKSSYKTTYVVPELVKARARISYVGGPIITGGAYAVIKDGRVKTTAYDSWYLFDISDWDGISNIDFMGFYQGSQGRISHVAIYPGPGPTVVPDGGSMAMLLGMALIALAGIRRVLA